MESVVLFEEVEITVKPGSSSLLSKGVLPIGKSAKVPTLAERKLEPSNDRERTFIELFGEYRIKSGCFGTLGTITSKLLGLTPTRAPSSKPAGSGKSAKAPKAPAKPAREIPVLSELGTEVRDLSAFTMSGVSASGKGTRMSTLLAYLLEELKLEHEVISITGHLGTRNHGLGYYFPSINTLFLGKWVRSNKGSRLLSWSSHDWLNQINDPAPFYEILQDIIVKLKVDNIVIEGYVCMPSGTHAYNVFTPKDKQLSLFTQFFIYPIERDEGFELLQQRVEGRSGGRIKGTCWNGNNGIKAAQEKHAEHLETTGAPGSSELKMFDDDVSSFGNMFLTELEARGQVDGGTVAHFTDWCVDNSTKRHTDDPESNYNRLSKFFESQEITLLVPFEEPAKEEDSDVEHSE